MKKFIAACAALLVFCASAPLVQAATPYASFSGGVAFLSNSEEKGGIGKDAIEFDAGYIVNGAVGLDADMYRVEGAVGYQSNGVDKYGGLPAADNEEVSILSFMANGYVDIPMNGAGVEPYLMAGIGVANVSVSNILGMDDSDTVLAYQFGAGLAIEASPNIAVDLGYRYFMASDATFEDIDPTVDYTISSHNILAGVRVGL